VGSRSGPDVIGKGGGKGSINKHMNQNTEIYNCNVVSYGMKLDLSHSGMKRYSEK
jgi:hypothetical protein